MSDGGLGLGSIPGTAFVDTEQLWVNSVELPPAAPEVRPEANLGTRTRVFYTLHQQGVGSTPCLHPYPVSAIRTPYPYL